MALVRTYFVCYLCLSKVHKKATLRLRPQESLLLGKNSFCKHTGWFFHGRPPPPPPLCLGQFFPPFLINNPVVYRHTKTHLMSVSVCFTVCARGQVQLSVYQVDVTERASFFLLCACAHSEGGQATKDRPTDGIHATIKNAPPRSCESG